MIPRKLDEFQSITSCLMSAIEGVRNMQSLRGDEFYELDDLVREALNVGGWIGWAKLRSYDWCRTDTRDVLTRCEVVIRTINQWCRDQIEAEIRAGYRKKSKKKAKVPFPADRWGSL